ncbi:Integrator complex subunit 9 [Holothuria leucospilota]|uniref:Integrator complex subunit 9 n=1 Tax=Holothuria leucospilota TaxID=206669 RepID=A0A9Q1BD96_HOLLE|nr:Integrator complex subunit 9 [Holothuria leucospilota]
MKLYSLSDHPSAPCLLLTFKGTSILLDCGLDMTSLQHFLPLTLVPSARLSKLPSWQPLMDKTSDKVLKNELRECGGRIFVDSDLELCVPEIPLINLSHVDTILISNYHCMLALPYITEYSDFKGTIYATEPTIQIGKMIMEELVEYIDRVPKRKRAVFWKSVDLKKLLPSPLKEVAHLSSWRSCYTKQDIQSCISKIKPAAFSEKLSLFGALKLTPLSSGYCLGSCNWVIKSEFEKIAYVSGTSLLTTHSTPVSQEPLKNCDVLIFTGITQTPTHNPDSMLGEFCSTLAVTIKNGGNVLVPCYPSGVLYDLFECLAGYMDKMGLGQTPFFFISPVAEMSLDYSQILSEWLCESKQSKAYLPEPPFPHADLIKDNWLKHFPSVHGEFTNHFKSPCVVFAGHPSLRMGDAVHFMEIWGGNSNNTVIFTEPDFPYLDALAPFQPLPMKAVYCPIDTALTYQQANKIIRELEPRQLVVPEKYLSPPLSMPSYTELVIEAEPSPVPFKRGEVIELAVKRKTERILIAQELAEDLTPSEVKPGQVYATIMGELTVRDNQYKIEKFTSASKLPFSMNSLQGRKRELEVDEGQDKLEGPILKKQIYDNLSVEDFVQNLAQHGITDIKVEDSPSGCIVHLQADDALIQIEEGSTHIFSVAGNEPLRRKLRDILVTCLPKF